jgi:hypothetical protein
MELQPIKLKKDQEIEYVSMNVGDNGGCVINYTIRTKAASYDKETHDSRTEIFGDTEVDSKALPRIMEIYKANFENKKATTGSEVNKAMVKG